MASMDETQTKPNRRRIDSDSGDVQYGNAGPEAFSGAERLDTLQTHVGNELVLDALSGQGDDAFLRLIGGEVSESIAAPGEGPFQSNAAMLRYMRDASIDWEDPALEKLAHPTGGRALNPEQLERFNAAFAHDFSHVRIHTDAAAARAAEALHAHAFALGSHIFFGSGTYEEGRAADRLLAHELTHVVQHDEGRLPKSGDEGVSHPSDPTEQEAYANEVRIVNKLDAIDAAMSSPDIEPESDASAQPEFTGPAGDVSATDVSDMEQPTLDNWPGFGGDAPEAPTEGEGVAIGGLAMRHRDALTEADTSDARVLKLIRQSRGTPIPDAVAERFGRAMGADVRGAVVHTDSAAAEAAALLNANAFALGADIFFADGQFAPGTADGDHLFLHELAHVVQYEDGRLPSSATEGLEVSQPTDGAEIEAEAVATQATLNLEGAHADASMAPGMEQADVALGQHAMRDKAEEEEPLDVDGALAQALADKEEVEVPEEEETPEIEETEPVVAEDGGEDTPVLESETIASGGGVEVSTTAPTATGPSLTVPSIDA